MYITYWERNSEERKFEWKWCQLGKCEQLETEIDIRDAVGILDYNELKWKIGNYKFSVGHEFVALEVQYHYQCRRDYLNKAPIYKRKTENESSGTSIHKLKSYVMKNYVKYVSNT